MLSEIKHREIAIPLDMGKSLKKDGWAARVRVRLIASRFDRDEGARGGAKSAAGA